MNCKICYDIIIKMQVNTGDFPVRLTSYYQGKFKTLVGTGKTVIKGSISLFPFPQHKINVNIHTHKETRRKEAFQRLCRTISPSMHAVTST